MPFLTGSARWLLRCGGRRSAARRPGLQPQHSLHGGDAIRRARRLRAARLRKHPSGAKRKNAPSGGYAAPTGPCQPVKNEPTTSPTRTPIPRGVLAWRLCSAIIIFGELTPSSPRQKQSSFMDATSVPPSAENFRRLANGGLILLCIGLLGGAVWVIVSRGSASKAEPQADVQRE